MAVRFLYSHNLGARPELCAQPIAKTRRRPYGSRAAGRRYCVTFYIGDHCISPLIDMTRAPSWCHIKTQLKFQNALIAYFASIADRTVPSAESFHTCSDSSLCALGSVNRCSDIREHQTLATAYKNITNGYKQGRLTKVLR